MTVLVPKNLNHNLAWHRAVAEVGGEYMAVPGAPPDEVVRACREGGVRALVVRDGDPAYYESLTDLEFLTFGCDPADVAAVAGLGRLRGLGFGGTWGGRLDFAALPNLEYFYVPELPKSGGWRRCSPGTGRCTTRRWAATRTLT